MYTVLFQLNSHYHLEFMMYHGLQKGKGDSKNLENEESEKLLKEYYIKKHYNSVSESVKLFRDDALCSKPGTYRIYMYPT